MCSECAKQDIDCVYWEPPNQTVAHSPMDPALLTPNSNMYSMAVDLVETDLISLLSCGAACSDAANVELGSVRILQHFQSVVSFTLGSQQVQDVMHNFVAKKAWSHPYLMHMVLAVSCAHQKRFAIGNSWALAEATNWDSGLQLYRQHLGNLTQGQGDGDWDAEVATTFLSIMFTFALDDELPLNSVDGGEDAFKHAMDPFTAIGGFRALFYIYGSMPESTWGHVLLSTDDSEGTFTSAQIGVQGLPRALAELCDLSESSCPTNNPYHRIVRTLTPLLYLQPSEENFSTLFAFSGRTWPDFKPLLLSKDPRALLLASYWLSLLKQVDQWWLTTRAKTECMAIVAYLSSLHDPKINALLNFPTAFGSADSSFMWQLLQHLLDDTIQ